MAIKTCDRAGKIRSMYVSVYWSWYHIQSMDSCH